MKRLYLSHPFGGQSENLHRAELWLAELQFQLGQAALVWAPWIPLCRFWADSGASRALGLKLDLEAVRQSDGLIAIDPSGSAGSQLELREARDRGLVPFVIEGIERLTFLGNGSPHFERLVNHFELERYKLTGAIRP